MKRRLSQGQSMVLFALAILALFAAAGLGIDGGRLFSARRRAQNAADSAAMAAALIIAQQRDGQVSAGDLQRARQAAIQRAQDNGFTIEPEDVQITKQNGVYYIDVNIPFKMQGTFISLIYHDPLRGNAAAQARVTPHREIAYGYALVATNEHICNALNFHLGHGGSVLVEGGIFSNTDATVASGHGGGSHGACVALFAKGGHGGTITADYIHTVAADEKSYFIGGHGGGSITITPLPEGGYPHLIFPDLPEAVCSQEGRFENGHYWPGRYPRGITVNRDAVFEPGVYCLEGDLRISGSDHAGGHHEHEGRAEAVEVNGEGVFFYMKSGSVRIHHASVNLKAARRGYSSTIDAAGNDWTGMLFYMPPSNPGEIKIHGHGTIVLQGTIYAPGASSRGHGHHARCMIGGHEDVTPDDPNYPTDDDPDMEGILQVICDTVRIGGHSQITLRYDSTYFFSIPVLDMTK